MQRGADFSELQLEPITINLDNSKNILKVHLNFMKKKDFNKALIYINVNPTKITNCTFDKEDNFPTSDFAQNETKNQCVINLSSSDMVQYQNNVK